MKEPNIEFYGVQPEEQKHIAEFIEKSGMRAKAVYHHHVINPDTFSAKSEANVLSVFIDSKVDAKVMDCFPNLSLITARSTGFDNIDIKGAKARGIAVSNVPSYGENTVAEFTFGLILSLSRKIYLAMRASQGLDIATSGNMRGFDLSQKTLGVIGTGRIGRHDIKIAKGFGMRVIAYDVNQDQGLSGELGFTYVSLDELLGNSDIVSIHVPYSKETHHMIDSAALLKMKKTALLVNTSRGGLIDTNALVSALRAKTIAGAALDVLEEEDIVKDEAAFLAGGHPEGHNLCAVLADHALLKMQNVIVTPHIAYNTGEALDRILDTTVSNIKAWAEGKAQNIVNP